MEDPVLTSLPLFSLLIRIYHYVVIFASYDYTHLNCIHYRYFHLSCITNFSQCSYSRISTTNRFVVTRWSIHPYNYRPLFSLSQCMYESFVFHLRTCFFLFSCRTLILSVPVDSLPQPLRLGENTTFARRVIHADQAGSP